MVASLKNIPPPNVNKYREHYRHLSVQPNTRDARNGVRKVSLPIVKQYNAETVRQNRKSRIDAENSNSDYQFEATLIQPNLSHSVMRESDLGRVTEADISPTFPTWKQD